MTAKIIWIVAGALVMVGAIIWFGKAVDSTDEAPEEKKPQA
jgi:flagellar basal body-associated protein FliL